MEGMFNGANGESSFNQPLNNWNVSNVGQRIYKRHHSKFVSDNGRSRSVYRVVFYFLIYFFFIPPIVTNMENMFELEGAVSFNQPLNKWNVSNVRDMYRMFAGARSFNQPLNKWNVSKVIDMYSMFEGARSFKCDDGEAMRDILLE